MLGGRAGLLCEIEGAVMTRQGNMSLRLITPKKLDVPRDGYEENKKISKEISIKVRLRA